MEHILGFAALLISTIVVVLCCMRWKDMQVILATAFIIRLLTALFQFYIAPLPDSDADAIAFEKTAWEWSQEPFALRFVTDYSFFISWIISILYRISDRSPLMAQSVSVLFGTLTVLVGWLLARELWGERPARRAAWFLAFFPTLILYSALIMREAYIWFFVLVGLMGVVGWLISPSIKNAILIVVGFVVGALFHGGVVAGLVVFLFLVILDGLRRTLRGLVFGYLHFIYLFEFFICLFLLTLYFSGLFKIPKLGSIEDVSNSIIILQNLDYATRGDASYPEWTKPTNMAEIFWKAPIRVAYFLFSPFIWDIRETQHLIGFFDGILYLFLLVTIWLNRRKIWQDRRARWLFLTLGGLILVFAFGVGNFGTAIRHRAKIVAVLIVLSAPRLPRVVFTLRYQKPPVTRYSKASLDEG